MLLIICVFRCHFLNIDHSDITGLKSEIISNISNISNKNRKNRILGA